jgi:glycine/D-amino acid oxidase-like deaminating enzyme
MTSKSLWMSVAVAPQASPLQGDERCDVAVIGSGIAGLSTAYELSQRGRSVIVIDRGPIAGGMTARTSAHLAPLCDDLMSEMQKIKGEEQSRLFYESQAAAVDRIEEIQKNGGIDCDFRRLDGYLFQGDDMPSDVIDAELDAVRAVGAPVERLVGVPLSGCESRHVLRYPRQATFHPLKYLAGVAEACAKRKVRFFANTPVEEIVEENGAVTVKTARGTIRAGHAVVATNSSIVDRVALHSKMSPYRTYVIGFAINRGVLPDALYWDTEEPYHYVRLQPGDNGKDFVLLGGADAFTGSRAFAAAGPQARRSRDAVYRSSQQALLRAQETSIYRGPWLARTGLASLNDYLKRNRLALSTCDGNGRGSYAVLRRAKQSASLVTRPPENHTCRMAFQIPADQ